MSVAVAMAAMTVFSICMGIFGAGVGIVVSRRRMITGR